RFVDKEEVQCVLPFRPAKEPCGSANDAAGILRVTGAGVFNMAHTRIGYVKSVIRFIANLDACELSALSPRCVAACTEEIDYCFVTVRSYPNFFARCEKRFDHA